LLHLKFKKHIKAGHGVHGTGNLKTGAEGDDQYIEVPIGTIAKDSETGEVLFEITADKEEKILVPGGRGGRGNSYFKSSINRAPQFAQPGEPGRENWMILELKILADVGLVGFPNAGKSTLLSVLSSAKPEIGDYAFTTLRPNLGIVPYRTHHSFIMADIPGIIEGAHTGKGLGLRFLRHIERNSILLFMIPADSDNIQKEYAVLLNELRQYNPELLNKERVLAITKSDMLDEEMKEQMKAEIPEIPYLFISSLAQQGLVELKDLLWKKLNNA
jgi:GTP-binding protein